MTVRIAPGPIPTVFDLRLAPNPAVSSIVMRFACAEYSPVTMQVYSLSGQRVATPVKGTYPPGEHAVQWTMADDRGRRLAPGMYVIRMTAGKFVRSRKLAITR